MHYISRLVFACLLIAPLALSGCGGNTAEKPSAQREKTITPEQLLQGQWKGQMVLQEDAKKRLTDKQIAKLESMTMGMEFQPEGKLVLVGLTDDGEPEEKLGAWHVLDARDDQITIKTIEENGKVTEAVLMLESDDAFLMPLKTEVANLGAMRFERLR